MQKITREESINTTIYDLLPEEISNNDVLSFCKFFYESCGGT